MVRYVVLADTENFGENNVEVSRIIYIFANGVFNLGYKSVKTSLHFYFYSVFFLRAD